MNEDNPDAAIVDFLCSAVTSVEINRDILINWQVELTDALDDLSAFASIIEENIVLSVDDVNDIDGYSKLPNVEVLLEKVSKLDEDIYHDFKLIILEILIYIISLSYNLRVRLYHLKLHHFLINKFLDLLQQMEEPTQVQANRSNGNSKDTDNSTSTTTDFRMDVSTFESRKPSTLKQYMRLVVLFFELGCDTPYLKKLVSPLYNSKQSPITKLYILELLQQVFSKYPSHFKFVIFNKASSFPFLNDDLKKVFTIQSWFKINHKLTSNDDPITLFKLTNSNASSNENPSTTLTIELINYNQFMIEIKNAHNGSRMQFTFNQILNNVDGQNSSDTSSNTRDTSNLNQGYTHFALTYDSYANLNLYIDGEYSESIPCPEIHKVLSTWNKVYIGSDANEVIGVAADEILIKNLTILSLSLSHEWINLLYNLGLGYEWDFKEFTNDNLHNLLNHLSFRGLINVGIKLDELHTQHNDPNKNHRHLFGDPSSRNRNQFAYTEMASRGSNIKSSMSSFLSSNSRPEKVALGDKNAIVRSLSKLKHDSILFDTNDFFQTLRTRQKIQSKSKSPVLLGPSSFLFHDSNSLHGSLYSIGGMSLLLTVIESSLDVGDSTVRDTLLYKSLSLLFTILDNNWRLSKEFENINGYGLLSVVLTNYKEKHNPTLTFSLLQEFDDNKSLENSTGCHGANLLNLMLGFAGYDFINPYESIIVNKLMYRFLILNFDLFFASDSFEYLLYHFQILIHGSRFKESNNLELSRMKVLKKFIQFLKTPALLGSGLSESLKYQLALSITSIIRSDPSVETIRSISLYIIFALYNDDCSSECGIIVLSALTDFLCDGNSSIKILKKFSRSITIHWILLLFKLENSKEVSLCGLRLLTRLLKVLGNHIIKRFFQVNHGLDILTNFLKHWWDDDDVLSAIFLSSFGIDRDEALDYKQKDKEDSNKDLISVLEVNLPILNQLLIPEFLILLNNLALNSMYTLSMKSGIMLGSNPSSPNKNKEEENFTLYFNVLHLTNEYADLISMGFEKNKSLRQIYLSKEFIEGISELLGYFHLSLGWTSPEVRSGFKKAFEKLTKVVANFFISNLGDNRIMDTVEGLSDFTKKLLLEIVFPKIFEHINEFVNVSNFIFNERQFLDSATNLLTYYDQEFLKQNYYVSVNDLNTYITSVASVIEVGNNNHSGIKKLRRQLGEALVLKFCLFGDDEDLHSERNTSHFKEAIKDLLFRQVTILEKDILDDKKLSDIIVLLLGIFIRLNQSQQEQNIEYTFNFMRTSYLMNQNEFSKVTKFIMADPELLSEFFNNLVTKNDEETFSRMQKYPPFTKGILRSFQSIMSTYKGSERLKATDMIRVTLHNGGKLGQMNSIYIKSFEKDCESLKSSIINGELVKFNRAIQDHNENIQFLISNYHVLKNDLSRLIDSTEKKKDYMLDYIENNDRMRKRLVIEDQLPESEKLSYNINIPLRQFNPVEDDNFVNLQNYDVAIAANGIDTFSLSTDSSILLADAADDSFESMDESQDSLNEESEARSSYEDKNRKVIRSLFMGDQILALWNISQVNGLVPIESLMILGTSHLYLIENYFHCQDGNVVDVQGAPPELRDPILQLVNSQSSNIIKNDVKSHRNKNWSLDKLSSISKRQFLLRDIALEMFFSDGASILITCLSMKDRDAIYGKLHSFATGRGIDSDLAQALQSSSSSFMYGTGNSLTNSPSSFFTSKLASAFGSTTPGTSNFISATRKWRMGEMSNFYYLMIINTLAGRTFNDLTQYPVFPWVIADYESENLDLSDPKTFRDLSKPMGAQTPERAHQFEERYEALDSLHDHDAPAFHYGTHYSSAMIVTSFLIRLKPYVQSYLLLQGGKFDHADRLFNSVEKAWVSASKDNTTDVRELTPEFFYLPEFLSNSNNFEFGTLQNGKSPNDVDLPPWAKGDPNIFIAKNREALESSYVSANLHLWIDLIFGYKQSGPEAVTSLNVFHHLSYNGAINLDNINDEVEKRAVIGMINNFGQTPLKIFNKPHIRKEVLNLPNYYLNLVDEEPGPKLLFESKLRMPIKKLEISSKNGKKWVGRPNCVSSEDELLIRKANDFKFDSGSLIINQTTFLNIHSSNITSILQMGNKQFLTGSEDGIINAWKCELRPSTTLQFHSVLRGHFCEVISMKFSESFNLGISLDEDGIVIVWDLTRFKFVRKMLPIEGTLSTQINISNDTGNIGIMYTTSESNILKIYTVNGDLLLSESFYPGDEVTSFNFGSINTSMVDVGKTMIISNHTHWSNEIFGIAVERTIELFELSPLGEDGWTLSKLDSLNLSNSIHGSITTFELLKSSEVDYEDKLCRGLIKLIIGDSTGKVYGL